jgi:hypothetical protein
MTFSDWTGWRGLALMEEMLQSAQNAGDLSAPSSRAISR